MKPESSKLGDSRPTVIRLERLDAGMTLRDLSEATGLSLSTIFRLDKGNSANITATDARNIAAVLGVPVERLFGEGGES
jgi:transcriptional regulator with XRE-family HTH domain